MDSLCNMSFAPNDKLFVGPFAHSNKEGELTIVNHAAIFVKNGKISNIVINPKTAYTAGEDVTILSDGQFLVPGFIDGHIHAVQFPNLGVGYDKELLAWLETYTFPLEKKYKDANFAATVFDSFVRHIIANGTTTACYFASLYAKASLLLAQKAAELGQRAFIGKLSMNIKRADGYYETTEESIVNLKKFIDDIAEIENPLVKPIVTPRFALSCDMKLMKELGQLAKEKNLHIQTHIAENLDEIEAVKNEFSEYTSYADVYDAAGLLTDKTVLAHAIYLTDNEITLLNKRSTAVIHCPSSNTCLSSGLCDVQRLKAGGIKIGLGTDVAGGQSCSILDAMRSALQVSAHLSLLKGNYKAINYRDVFHMATMGGAMALGIDDEVGNFMVGKQFDALVVNMNINTGYLGNLIHNTNTEENLQKFIYSGDDRNITKVYVNGRKIK